MSTNKSFLEIGVVSTNKKLPKPSIKMDALEREIKTQPKGRENQVSREVVLRLITWLEKM
jgi:hypothetical protein